ncbi:hypothetical protein KP509_36G026700 [Ceratopteris richardii]|uniref:Uncharacterized protein n=1 Tax=Ceratopteris richardii TaxID=49495 RepID=A0A8T2QBG2_CERRI|nr:hypothetical protein KP509_36G026700 [Ceratopteris richardii]
MTCTRTTGFMSADLMYCQKPSFPVHTEILTWTMLPWEDNLFTEDLLALRIQQLEQAYKRLEETVAKLKDSRLKNKKYFDKSHSTFERQYDARRKLKKHWFGPYVVVKIYENGTYALRELDGTPLKNLIAGKRVKLFKQRNEEIYDLSYDEENDE